MAECKKLVVEVCEYNLALSLEELAYIKGFTEKTMLASVTWERCQPTKTGLLFAQENTPYRVYE